MPAGAACLPQDYITENIKNTMEAKKSLIPTAVRFFAMALVLAAYAGANMLIDPFGIFGDPLFDWYSYNETNNPRTAKLAWLEERHEEFDSYIIGSSCSASYSTAELNEYLDARFYNMFVYGSDIQDYRDHAAYLLEHYEVKNLLLNLNLTEAVTYGTGEDDINYRMHALATGKNLPLFYLRYAFASSQYAIDKVSAYFRDTFLPQSFDVFDAATGCYDKRVRDVEKIGDPDVYQAAHGADFYFSHPGAEELPYLDECVQAIADIRDMCAEKGVNLLVVCSPAYAAQLDAYGEAALRRYKTAVAQTVDFWDFSCTPLSYDSRYFYDASHFRNAVGTMVLAEIFGNEDVYRPDDFGAFVTAGTCGAYLDRLSENPPAADPAAYTAEVPILMYHHFSGSEAGAVTPELFAAHLEALRSAGYTAVSFQEMIEYVYQGKSLPDKPVCITMDDGYLSNYEIAWPLLEEYGMKGTVFAIGTSVGHREFYKDTEFRLTPHFGYEEAREMQSSGVLDFQSHTYDMHQWEPFETGDQIRTCALPLEGETDGDYAAALAADLERYGAERRAELGEDFCALAYPGGYYNTLSEVLIHQAGIPVTLSIQTDSRNVLVKGLPQSLYALCRWNVTADTTPEALLQMVGGQRG